MNLAAFVKDGEFQEDEFRDAVRICVRALNDVLDEGLPLLRYGVDQLKLFGISKIPILQPQI